MRRSLAPAFILCFAATALAQSGLTGKWLTDRPADPLLRTEAQRKQSVQLDLTIGNGTASGGLAIGGLGGTFHTFKDGRVNGNKVQFRTSTVYPEQTVHVTWFVELVDANTVMVSQEAPDIDWAGVANRVQFFVPPAPAVAPVQPTADDSIRGVVRDVSKALIPGVTVTATKLDSGAQTTTITTDAGSYSFPRMTPGQYRISASLPGFQTLTVNDLGIGDALLVQDFTLEVARPRPASVNPDLTSCSRNSMVWCAVLHRAK